MYNINIGDNVLAAIIIIVLAFSLIILYYINRKYKSLDLYNMLILFLDKYHTYKENKNQYKINSKNYDTVTDDEIEILNKFISTINKFRGSG